jgi:hypothetical protein
VIAPGQDKCHLPDSGKATGMLTCMLLAFAALVPQMLLAEGAVRILDCEIAGTCTATLECTPASGAVTFRMEPQSLDGNNAGTYVISYDDTQASMQGLSYAGPFHWRTDSTMHTLLASSETQFLWHSLELSQPPVTVIRDLKCRFLQ